MSSTIHIPEVTETPRHIAIIMDGNGRWANQRHLPRIAGHKKGVDAVRKVVELCAKKGVSYLTLFAFSSENWRRPADEVSLLMRLFIIALEREVEKLERNGIRLKVVGDLSAFEPRLQELIQVSEAKTADNDVMTLTIAANYGGRWDILQAVQKMLRNPPFDMTDGKVPAVAEDHLLPHLSMHYAPEPDLFIRTGGEQRISNFLIWQLAYTELYFTPCYWPEFDADELEKALLFYKTRERRFGRTSAQVQTS